MKRLTILLFCLVVGPQALAHPVPYQGAFGVMTWNQPFMSDTWLTYSFRPDMALAGRFMRMEMPEGEFRYSGAQLDYLVYRDNGIDHQVNFYAYAGAGGVHFNDNTGGAAFYGVEADAENRKFFGLIKAEQMNASIGPDFSHAEARLGVAPYKAEYNEIASWLMVQAQWHPSLSRQFVLTPLARFFYKSALWEMGVSTDGEWMLNFMFHL
jgi:hypothetical protein